GTVERLFEVVLGLPFGEEIVDDLETKHQSLKTLQQRVVQLPRDPRTLGDSLLETGVDAIDGKAQTQAINEDDTGCRRRGYQQQKRSGLVKGRHLLQYQRR